MSTPEGEKKMPEWSIFDRLDELEDITLKLWEKADTTEPTLKDIAIAVRDVHILATAAFGIGFWLIALGLKNPRALEDDYIHGFKKAGLSQKRLEFVEGLLTAACEHIEESKAGK